MAEVISEVLAWALPWLGGVVGVTVIYFGVMVYLQYRHGQRLKRIEHEQSLQRGILLGLLAREGSIKYEFRSAKPKR